MLHETLQYKEYTIECKPISDDPTLGWKFEIRVTGASELAFSILIKNTGDFPGDDETRVLEVGKFNIPYLIDRTSFTPGIKEYFYSSNADDGNRLTPIPCSDPEYPCHEHIIVPPPSPHPLPDRR